MQGLDGAAPAQHDGKGGAGAMGLVLNEALEDIGMTAGGLSAEVERLRSRFVEMRETMDRIFCDLGWSDDPEEPDAGQDD